MFVRTAFLSLLLVTPIHASDPFAKDAERAERSMVDAIPTIPGVGLPRAEMDAVEKEIDATPPSELNVRCQGLLAALGQAAKLRKDVMAVADTEKAIDRLQTALVNEAVAAAGEGYSVKERLAQGASAAKAMVPKVKDAALRWVRLLREPSKADEQTLANQQAVCSAVLAKAAGK